VLPTKHRFVPVSTSDRVHIHDANVCDSCDQISESLEEINGDWLCEDCKAENLVESPKPVY
jgi:formylmethanofuran dehydrogenase subunit E